MQSVRDARVATAGRTDKTLHSSTPPPLAAFASVNGHAQAHVRGIDQRTATPRPVRN